MFGVGIILHSLTLIWQAAPRPTKKPVLLVASMTGAVGPQTKLREGNVFTGICLPGVGWGGWELLVGNIKCIMGYVTWWGYHQTLGPTLTLTSDLGTYPSHPDIRPEDLPPQVTSGGGNKLKHVWFPSYGFQVLFSLDTYLLWHQLNCKQLKMLTTYCMICLLGLWFKNLLLWSHRVRKCVSWTHKLLLMLLKFWFQIACSIAQLQLLHNNQWYLRLIKSYLQSVCWKGHHYMYKNLRFQSSCLNPCQHLRSLEFNPKLSSIHICTLQLDKQDGRWPSVTLHTSFIATPWDNTNTKELL